MSNVPDDLKYTRKDEWARIEGNRVTVGLTDHAQEQLTDIVYLELPEVGKEIKAGDVLASVESVKSTGDVFAPVSGKVVEVNTAIVDDPGTINRDPYGDGWLAVIESSETNPELLSPAEYKVHVASQAH